MTFETQDGAAIWDGLIRIESQLSRIADAQESPFWGLSARGNAKIFYGGNGEWVCEWGDRDDSDVVYLTGTGPTPQAAVDSFNEAFKGGAK